MNETPYVLARIREASRRFLRDAADAGDENRLAFLQVSKNVFEQIHHGTTDAALAMWDHFRCFWRSAVIRAEGKPDYLVPGMDGKRTIAEPALILHLRAGQQLVFTGCSWGYGGEGAWGSALILADAGFFSTAELAMKFIQNREFNGAWEISRGDSNI